jgi:hypothetical protein
MYERIDGREHEETAHPSECSDRWFAVSEALAFR